MGKHVELSARLWAIAGQVTSGNRLADIGTDHAYLPIELVRSGKVPSAIAMDINPGPLKGAREHIREAGLDEKIQVRQSDGLQALRPGEADTIVISGMGGAMIRNILSRGKKVWESADEAVLSPQSEIPETRRFLRGQGFYLSDEDMIREDGKYYVILHVRKKKAPDSRDPALPETVRDYCGPVLLKKRHPVLLEWLRREQSIQERILASLQAHGSKKQSRRLAEVEQKREMIRTAIEYMNHREK